MDQYRCNDRVNDIIRYEGGELSPSETLKLYQALIKDRSCWTLQGHYGRTAMHLIKSGIITLDGEKGENYDTSFDDEF